MDLKIRFHIKLRVCLCNNFFYQLSTVAPSSLCEITKCIKNKLFRLYQVFEVYVITYK